MIIPIANAIFEKILILIFYTKQNEEKFENNLIFLVLITKYFQRLIKKIVSNYVNIIIVNACNEILVEQFLTKKIAFYDIFKFIMSVLKDKNYKKIRRPKILIKC